MCLSYLVYHYPSLFDVEVKKKKLEVNSLEKDKILHGHQYHQVHQFMQQNNQHQKSKYIKILKNLKQFEHHIILQKYLVVIY